jgi:hypothetical protein
MHTLKPPAVPALITRSGLNAWMEAYVTRDAETVPTLSTPEKDIETIKNCIFHNVKKVMKHNLGTSMNWYLPIPCHKDTKYKLASSFRFHLFS